MHVTELEIHKLMGMRLAGEGEAHILELPESPLLLNHLGTVHAGVQFVLAEACGGEFLLRHFGHDASQGLAVLRTAQVKFCKPARGRLRAAARFNRAFDLSLARLASRGQSFASVFVEVSDENGVVTLRGQYDWFLRRKN